MREVLFRGKTKTGFWIEGFLFQTTCDGVQEWCISSSPLSANDYSEILGDYGEVIPESISEFTGLTDKNGKKIFEGDIVKCISSDFVGRPKTDTITVNDMTDYNTLVYLNCSNEIEVIGNIHDNSELLKGE